MTRGRLPQTVGVPGLNGGGAAATVPLVMSRVLRQSRDIIYDVTNRCTIGTSCRLPIGREPVNRLVSETFSIKVADKQTHREASQLMIRVTMLTVCEPTTTIIAINLTIYIHY